MIEKSKANLSDVDGFTEFVRTIQGVEVAFMIQEVSPHSHRINFRSSGYYIAVDGTSASSPSVSGMIAMINYLRLSQNKSSVGLDS